MSEVALPTTSSVAKPAEVDISAYAALARKEKMLRETIAGLKTELDMVQEQIQVAIGDAEMGLIDGRPVFTHARIEKLRGADLKKDYPVIYESCSKDVVKRELDPALLKLAHPNLYREYQSRQFRRVD